MWQYERLREYGAHVFLRLDGVGTGGQQSGQKSPEGGNILAEIALGRFPHHTCLTTPSPIPRFSAFAL